MGIALFPIVLVLLLVPYGALIYWRGWQEGVQLSSIIATTLATVAIASFAYLQIEEVKRGRTVQESTKGVELNSVIAQISPLCLPHLFSFIQKDRIKWTPRQERAEWASKVQKLLESQLGNPVLIQNKKLFAYWKYSIVLISGMTSKGRLSDDEFDKNFFDKALGISPFIQACLELQKLYFEQQWQALGVSPLLTEKERAEVLKGFGISPSPLFLEKR